MFETDKTIMGSRTNLEIDINNKEKLVYNYEVKKRLLEVFVYGNTYTIKKEDALSLKLENLNEYNESLVVIDKSFLKEKENDSNFEIRYIKK